MGGGRGREGVRREEANRINQLQSTSVILEFSPLNSLLLAALLSLFWKNDRERER